MLDLGGVDMSKVRNLAKLAGISDVDLAAGLESNNLSGLSFSSSS